MTRDRSQDIRESLCRFRWLETEFTCASATLVAIQTQPLLFQCGECAHAGRQRHPRLDRVKLIGIDPIDAERPQTGLAGLAQVTRSAVGHPRPSGRVRPPLVATVRRDRSPLQAASALAMRRSLCPISESSRQSTSAVSRSAAPASKAVWRTSMPRASSRSRSVESRIQPMPMGLMCPVVQNARCKMQKEAQFKSTAAANDDSVSSLLHFAF